MTGVSAETRPVWMVMVYRVAPAGTRDELMLLATKPLLLLRFTTMPVGGAGALKVSVAVVLSPPLTGLGAMVSRVRTGAGRYGIHLFASAPAPVVVRAPPKSCSTGLVPPEKPTPRPPAPAPLGSSPVPRSTASTVYA